LIEPERAGRAALVGWVFAILAAMVPPPLCMYGAPPTVRVTRSLSASYP